MKNKVVLVTGMHRSGTSVTTQWLNRCGLFIGDKLLGPGIGNVDGHFEDEDFFHLHETLLRSKGLPETGLTGMPVAKLTEAENEIVSGLLATKSKQHEQWGWKEPRTSLFLDTYSNLIPQACYFVVVRNYNDTVSSLVTREYKLQEEKISRKKGLSKLKWKLFKRKSQGQLMHQLATGFLKTWINYYEHILACIANVPDERLVVISCPQLLWRDKAVFAKLTQLWGLVLEFHSFSSIFKQQYISDTLSVDGYVSDKHLLSKAQAIEEQLQMKYGISF